MKHFGLRITGLLLFLLAIIGLIATTLLSISGGANDYTNINKLANGQIKDYLGIFKLLGFVMGTVFIQLMIFAASSIESFIKNKFYRHYIKVLLLQYGLLIVSIYYNYMFFGHNSMIKLLLCILLDLAVIKLVSLAMDLLTLNYTLANKKDEAKNIFRMWIDNKLFGLKNEIIQTYNSNNNLDLKEEVKVEVLESEYKVGTSENIENTKDNVLYLEDKKPSEDIIKYIENYKDGDKIPVNEVKTIFGLTKRQWEKIRDNSNLLLVKNGFTYKK
jgi:hypothetical protein